LRTSRSCYRSFPRSYG